MIIGLGIDLCDIRRIESTLSRFGERFTQRIFTERERARSDRRADRAASYARRFAAKEAAAKALGTGVPRRGVSWTDLGVVNLPTGQPTLALTGGAAQRLQALTPEDAVMRIQLTMTDDYPWAQAMVVIEALWGREAEVAQQLASGAVQTALGQTALGQARPPSPDGAPKPPRPLPAEPAS